MKKVKEKDFKPFSDLVYPENKFNLPNLFSDYPECKKNIGSEGKGKRFRSNAFEKIIAFSETKQSEDDIEVRGLIKNQRVVRYINKKYVDESLTLNKYKILVPQANGSGAIGEVLSTPMVGYTGSFIGVGTFENQQEAENCMKYIKTKFARAILGTLKITQHNEKETWHNVPLQDFTASSDIDWSKPIAAIDRQLYKKYNLDAIEIAFIGKNVRAME